jgi:hypothetical protein
MCWSAGSPFPRALSPLGRIVLARPIPSSRCSMVYAPVPGTVSRVDQSRGLPLAASEELLKLGWGARGRPGRALWATRIQFCDSVALLSTACVARGSPCSKRTHQAANTPRLKGVLYVLMVSRRELRTTGRKVFFKPLVVLAAKCLGPGRLRLEMVKLAHDLGDRDESFQSLHGRSRPRALPTYEAPAQRAA